MKRLFLLAPTAFALCASLAAPCFADDPPAPVNPDDVGRFADEARARATVLTEEQKLLVADALVKAREAMKTARFDDARTWFGKALDLDPLNVEAREGWRNLNADRPSSVGEYGERMSREEVVRRESAVAEVRAHMNKGRGLASSGDFAGAVREYRAAQAIVGWYPNQDAFGVTSDSLQRLIDETNVQAARTARDQRADAIQRAQGAKLEELRAQREERMGRIRAFFTAADHAYRRGEYATARENAKMVLSEDPQNDSALRLIDLSHDAETLAVRDENQRRFDEEWKHVFERIERDVLPQVRPLEFPDDWAVIAARRSRTVAGAAAPTDSEGKATILAALDAKRVKGLDFKDNNLDDVVGYLRTITSLNFHVSQKVRSTKFEDVKITLGPLDDVSVRQVLDLVTKPYDLRWEPRNGVVTIALKEEISGRLVQDMFDVRDLNVKIQSYRGTDIYLAPSGFTPPEPPELPEAAPIFDPTALTDMIKAVIDPDSWAAEGAVAEIKNGQLIAKNTPENLAAIGHLLERLRETAGPLVHLEVRFLTVEDNFLRDVGVDVRGLGDNSQGVGAAGLGSNAPHDDVFFGTPANPQGVPFGIHPEPSSVGTSNDSGIFYNDGQDGAYQARVENLFDTVLGNTTGLGNPNVLTGSGGLAFQHTFLDDTQMEVILRAVQKQERLQTIKALQTTVWNTQRGVVEVLNKVSYVADYDVEIAQASNIANPIIKHAIDGVVLDVKPIVSADRRFITLELRPSVASLVRPIPTFSTSLASGPVTASAPVVIQVPRLQKSSVRTTVTMPDGGTLLLGGLKFYESQDATSEIPIFGKLPLVGFLFSRKGSYVNRRNLVILITATVVAPDELEPKGGYVPPPVARPILMDDPLCEEAPACAPPPACECPSGSCDVPRR